MDVVIQDDFSAGEILDVAPHLIPSNGARSIGDGLLDDGGSVYRRGGTAWITTEDFGAPLRWGFDGEFDVGRRTIFANADSFGAIGEDGTTPVDLEGDGLTAPPPSALIAGLLFIGGGYIYGGSRQAGDTLHGTLDVTEDDDTVTGHGTDWDDWVDPGMLFQAHPAERVYVIASVDSATQLTLVEPYAGTTAAGITTSDFLITPIYKITAADPYADAEVYAVCQGRLVWAVDEFIRFSPLGDPHSHDENDEHELPEGAQVIAITAMGSYAILFSTAGIWVLQGLAVNIVDEEGNAQHRLTVLSRELVLWGPAGLAYWDQVCVAPCISGVFLLDGISAPVLISKNIGPLYEHYTTRGFRPGGASVYRDHYFLPILAADGEVRDTRVCRLSRLGLDARRKVGFPWTHLTSKGGQMSAYALRVEDDAIRAPVLLGFEGSGSARVADCSPYFNPDGAHKTDPDERAHNLEIITRDILTGANTLNFVRYLRLWYELNDAGSDRPVFRSSYSDAQVVSQGTANWDEVLWDEFDWDGDEAGSAFIALNCDAPANPDPRHAHRCRVNRRLRLIRFRVTSQRPTPWAAVRSITAEIRPSQAVRR